MLDGKRQGGHRPHREAEQVDRLEAQRVGECGEVIDEPLRAEAVGDVPARAGVTSGVGQVDAEQVRQDGQLGREVVAARRTGAMEEHDRRPMPTDRIGHLQVVGVDRRHRRGRA